VTGSPVVLSPPANRASSTCTATVSPASKQSSHNQKTDHSSSGVPIPLQLIGTPVPSASQAAPQSTCPANQTHSTRTHDVHLCVEASSRRFKTLDCKDLRTDIEFFNKIKLEYNEARGWCRLWFSTWTYDFCDFFVFQKHGINLSARLKIGHPDANDTSYDFSPRPPEYLPPDGPISHDEFHFHYYYDLCPSYTSWTRWLASSYLATMGPSAANRTALNSAPKRTTKLDMEDGKRELFYGLYTKEARSAFRVVM
jgi:hypothetical protein